MGLLVHISVRLEQYEILNRGLHESNKSMGVRRAEGWSVSVDDRSGADEF